MTRAQGCEKSGLAGMGESMSLPNRWRGRHQPGFMVAASTQSPRIATCFPIPLRSRLPHAPHGSLTGHLTGRPGKSLGKTEVLTGSRVQQGGMPPPAQIFLLLFLFLLLLPLGQARHPPNAPLLSRAESRFRIGIPYPRPGMPVPRKAASLREVNDAPASKMVSSSVARRGQERSREV